MMTIFVFVVFEIHLKKENLYIMKQFIIVL